MPATEKKYLMITVNQALCGKGRINMPHKPAIMEDLT